MNDRTRPPLAGPDDPYITIREKDLRDAWLRLDAVGDPRTAHTLWQHLLGVTLTGVRSSEVDGLDAERLSRALRNVAWPGYAEDMVEPIEVGDLSDNGYATSAELAEHIAREYRALTGDTGPKVEPEPETP